jgi:hypothetical protein
VLVIDELGCQSHAADAANVLFRVRETLRQKSENPRRKRL